MFLHMKTSNFEKAHKFVYGVWRTSQALRFCQIRSEERGIWSTNWKEPESDNVAEGGSWRTANRIQSGKVQIEAIDWPTVGLMQGKYER
jgi:hypothetical protein